MHTTSETANTPTDMSKIRTLEEWIRFDEARSEVDDISRLCAEMNRKLLSKKSRARR
jgi:hypothetical protein